MIVLRNLKKFIKAKDIDGERHEIREYVRENAEDIAEALGVAVAELRTAIAAVAEDGVLVRELLASIKTASRERRYVRAAERARGAQESADVLAAAAYWDGERCVVDVVSLLASALTRGDDLLVFASPGVGGDVAVRMGPLFQLARLERADLSAFVDARGLHVRWPTGGLNFVPHIDPRAERVVMHLPAKPGAAQEAA